MGMYVVGRWNALQLSGYCHKEQCLITNKHWFNQGPEYHWIDKLQLSSSLWGALVRMIGVCEREREREQAEVCSRAVAWL